MLSEDIHCNCHIFMAVTRCFQSRRVAVKNFEDKVSSDSKLCKTDAGPRCESASGTILNGETRKAVVLPTEATRAGVVHACYNVKACER